MRHRARDTHGNAIRRVCLLLLLAVAHLTPARSRRTRTRRSPSDPCDSSFRRVTAPVRMLIILPPILPLTFSYMTSPSTGAFHVPFISRPWSTPRSFPRERLRGRPDLACLIGCAGLALNAPSSLLRLAPPLSAGPRRTSAPLHLSPQADDGPTSSRKGRTAFGTRPPRETDWNPVNDPWPLPFEASDRWGSASHSHRWWLCVCCSSSVPVPAQECPEHRRHGLRWSTPAHSLALRRYRSVRVPPIPPASRPSTTEQSMSTCPNCRVAAATNDANPAVWVIYAVTIDVIARAGPPGWDGQSAASTTFRCNHIRQRV